MQTIYSADVLLKSHLVFDNESEVGKVYLSFMSFNPSNEHVFKPCMRTRSLHDLHEYIFQQTLCANQTTISGYLQNKTRYS